MSNKETRWVAVDDTDPSILWTGDWFDSDEQFDGALNSFGPVHLGSQHATRSAGGLAFTFQGSQVRLYGTSQQTNTSTLQDPLWDCSVDGVMYGHESGYEAGPINQWNLCSIDLANASEHTLLVGAAVSRATFYVDSIMYRPSYELRDSLHPTVYLHHSDSAIKYSNGGWVAHQGDQARLTRQNGAKMKVAFNGTKATWIGRIPQGFPLANSTATYSIDGKAPVEFDVMGLPANAGEGLFYHPLFETPELSQGEHTLEVVHKGPAAPLVLEYFLVDHSDIVQPQGLSLDFNDAERPSERGGGNRTHKAPIGAIVGGAVGGVVVLSIVGILLYFYLKKKKGNTAQIDLLPSVVHSPTSPSGHIPLPTPSPSMGQVNSSTNLLAAPSPPIMTVTPTSPMPSFPASHHVPLSSNAYTSLPVQARPQTNQFAHYSDETSSSNDPPQYEESPSNSPYPVDVKRPVSGSGQPSSNPVVLSAPQNSSDTPYDLGLLGLAGGSSSYRDSSYSKR